MIRSITIGIALGLVAPPLNLLLAFLVKGWSWTLFLRNSASQIGPLPVWGWLIIAAAFMGFLTADDKTDTLVALSLPFLMTIPLALVYVPVAAGFGWFPFPL